jgi:hypothetical protein
MTATRPSRTIPAQGPHRPRKANVVRRRRTSQRNTPKSTALQPPCRNMRGTRKVGSTVNMIIATRQPHQFGRAAPNENDKSP